jgi:hypothetical protein
MMRVQKPFYTGEQERSEIASATPEIVNTFQNQFYLFKYFDFVAEKKLNVKVIYPI